MSGKFELNKGEKVEWFVDVNSFTWEVIDMDAMVVDENLMIGNDHHGGIVRVSIHPTKEEAERCGKDYGKILETIKSKYESLLTREAHGLCFPDTLSYKKVEEMIAAVRRERRMIKCDDIKQFTSSSSYSVDFSMRGLVSAMKDYERMGLQVNPDFQRGHVWTRQQQIAFVEYFLRGGKSGSTIYLNHPSWGGSLGKRKKEYDEFTLVDGLQRVTAVQDFFDGKLPVFGGKYIGDFKDDWIFDDYVHHKFTVCINNLKSKEEVLQWYIDMNRGGTPHSKEEISRVCELLSKEKSRCKEICDASELKDFFEDASELEM